MSQIEASIYSAFFEKIAAQDSLPEALVAALQGRMTSSTPALKADELVSLINEHVNPEQL